MASTTERQAYDTHLNYISCLNTLLNGTTLRYTGTLQKAATPFVADKKNLISLTKKSLTDERNIVEIDKDYSYASTSWLPIKSYYLIFNTLLTIEYIFKLQKRSFNLGHTNCVDEFTRKLKNGEIQFSNQTLNQVFDQSILTDKFTPGANLSRRTNDTDMYKMTMRKIAWYKEEDWKRKNNINLKNKTHRARLKHHLANNFTVSIFDSRIT